DVRWGVRVTGVEAGSDAVAVVTGRGRFEAPIAIGAGGHHCPVAKALGDVSEREEVVAAQESETRLPPEWVQRLGDSMRAPELYVEPDLRGYGWYFPKQDFVNIGIGCTGGSDGSLPRRREALVQALRASGRPPRLPETAARLAVRLVLGLGLARRRIVFDAIFGMKEAAS